jgi:hypothetical protein
VWFGRELRILETAKKRWSTLSIEDRTVIAYALQDAIHNPNWVGDYTLRLHAIKITGEVVQVHEFRIGFANFIFVDTASALNIYDFWVDDDMALAAE